MRKTIFLMLLVLSLIIPCWGYGEPGTLEVSFSFPRNGLTITKQNGYDLLRLKGCEFWNRAGEPQIPVFVGSVALPQGATFEGIEVLKATRKPLRGNYRILPVQESIPLSEYANTRVAFTPPCPDIYQAKGYFPNRLFQVTGRGNVMGQEVVNLLIYPVQYSPSDGKVVLYTHIRLRVSYQGGELQKSAQLNISRLNSAQALLRKRVLNPAVVQPVVAGKDWQKKKMNIKSSELQPGEYRYVIITSASFAGAFQPLVEWKTKKGVPATIVTTEWIQTNYSGRDLAEKIRNCIKDTVASWGTEYVLLGGDTNVVPDRIAFAMESGKGADRDDIRCDLYYADLDGSFDADGDNIFGEVEDQIDLYPDVFIGRAPVDTINEVQTFVNKVLTYEKNPPADYLLKVLYAAEIEQDVPLSDSSISADYIDAHYIPAYFKPATKLYQRLGNENPTTVRNALNQGFHFINHLGHAWYYKLRVGGSGNYLYRSDMDSLTNGTRYGILYSTGCWPGAIDRDCIAEHFVNCTSGGGIAFIGNSRYGWFSPGNPLFGHSDRFHHWFYKTLFCDGIYRLGEVVAGEKMHFIPWSREENIYRWHQYEINLLGDPEMPIWTDTPHTLTVHHPQEIPTAGIPFPIQVMQDNTPSSGALVCVSKGTEVYAYGYTDNTGHITFTINPQTVGQLAVTITAHNCLPYEGITTVTDTARYIAISHTAIDDDSKGKSMGNGDGQVNPGEAIEWEITLKNYSAQTINGISATLELLQPSYQNFGAQMYGDLVPGAEVMQKFDIPVSANAENGEVYLFRLTITDQEHNEWIYYPGFVVASAQILPDSFRIDDSAGGDGDGIPEPGETILLELTLYNSGLGYVNNVWVHIISNNECLQVLDGTVEYGNFSAGEKRSGTKPFTLSIPPACTGAYFVALQLQIQGSGYNSSDQILLFGIGDVGFSDDMETGSAQWTLEGANNLWHLSTHRTHSGSWSWYCGHEGSFVYDNNMNCAIKTPELTLPPNAELSFWRWYELPIYGSNGLYVELWVDGEWHVLDFIGSGGALNDDDDKLTAGLLSSWFQERYDLSSYPPGTTCRLRFRFVSDDEPVEEGFYLDDIVVKSQGSPFMTEARDFWILY